VKIRAWEPKRSRIEMVPLIDSFFLILVYFIYSFLSLSVHRGIPMQLPEARTAVDGEEEHHGISVTAAGEIFLDRRLMEGEGLRPALMALKAGARDRPFSLSIYGDENARHGLVVSVLDAVREAGITKVVVETDLKSDDT